MPADPQRVQAVFLTAAAEPDAEAQAAILDRECGDDRELHRRVAALLSAHRDANSLVDRPVVDPQMTVQQSEDPVAAEGPGTVIGGRYKLLECIGEGGMGAVFVAEQTVPVRRKVALKLIRAGMDSRSVLARFEAERQALALMDHPNIARVLDGGLTDNNRPYFVMEYIKGVPLTEYCDAVKLGVPERLDLFVAVCQAVQHAHQKGIIHRDLKPSNILVALYDGKPVPKVIDFGLAKAMHQPLTEHSLHTGHQVVLGTPLYMSPEQSELNNLDVDTRTDIYSLGVVLYELLIGRTPIDRDRFKKAAWQEMLRLIREEEPLKPSTKLSGSAELPSVAANRQLEPARLSKLIRGDLDWITMKALEKDRGRRYETANGFAADVLRYLAGEPVNAHPPSRAYRLKKFLRKNKGPVIAAGVVAAALVAGLIGTTWQWQRALGAEQNAITERDDANEQRRRTRMALDDMLGDESLAFLTTQSNLLPQQRAFLDRALKYYQEFASRAATDEEGRAMVARAQDRLGHIHDTLGKMQDAMTAYRAAVASYDVLATDFPANPRYRKGFAGCLCNLAVVFGKTGLLADAEAALRAAAAEQEKLAADFPTVAVYRHDLAKSKSNLGLALRHLYRPDAAEVAFLAALAVDEKLVADFPGAPQYQSSLAADLDNLAILLLDRLKHAEAEKKYRDSLLVRKKLAEDFPAEPQYRSDVALSHNNLAANLIDSGKAPQAEAEFRSALAGQEKLARDFPGVPGYRQNLARYHHHLGFALIRLGRAEEAQANFRTALRLQERLVAEEPSMPEFRSELARSHRDLADSLIELSRPTEALAANRAAIAVQQKLVDDHPADPGHKIALAQSHDAQGRLFSIIGERENAEAAHRMALSIRARLAADDPKEPGHRQMLAVSHANLAALFATLSKHKDAEAEYRIALNLLENVVREFPSVPGYRQELASSHSNFSMLLASLGRMKEAETADRAALNLRESLVREFPDFRVYREQLATSQMNRGAVLEALDKREEAKAAYWAARDLWDKLVVDFPEVRGYRLGLASSHINVGVWLQNETRWEDAEAAYRAALRIYDQFIAGSTTQIEEDVVTRCIVWDNLGELAFDRGDPTAALNWFAKTIATLEPMHRADPRLALVRLHLRTAEKFRAAALARLGRHAEALPHWDRALALAGEPERATLRLGRADSLARAGDAARALAAADELALEKTLTGGQKYKLAQVFTLIGATLPPADAVRAAAQAAAFKQRAFATGFPELANVMRPDNLDALRLRIDYADLLWELADGFKP